MGERENMKKHIHGGNVYKYKGCLDFSANCNPLGTPESVKQAVIRSLDMVADYPQVGCGALREVVAEYEEVDRDWLICGNGAADLIFSLCRAVKPKRALLPAPTFAEYEQALRSVDCEIQYYYLPGACGPGRENRTHSPAAGDFALQQDYLDTLRDGIEIAFLCNPNNPTGILTEREFLLRVLERCRERRILLVVDECFLDFVKEPGAYTLKAQLSEYDNLFLLKAFTKRYAMAGVRLGYGLTGNRRLLEQMELMTQPWNVSSLAQAAGIAALGEREYVERGRCLVFQEKEYLMREMKGLGLEVYPSQANYIFFQGPETLFEECVKKGLLIRDCGNYEGLRAGFYRVAVKKHEDNKRLIAGLKEILAPDTGNEANCGELRRR